MTIPGRYKLVKTINTHNNEPHVDNANVSIINNTYDVIFTDLKRPAYFVPSNDNDGSVVKTSSVRGIHISDDLQHLTVNTTLTIYVFERASE